MKSRNTNLEAVEPEPDKQGPHNSVENSMESIGRRPHNTHIRLGREVQARIGELLRAMYNSYVNQGVPQHLAELVDRLGEQDSEHH